MVATPMAAKRRLAVRTMGAKPKRRQQVWSRRASRKVTRIAGGLKRSAPTPIDASRPQALPESAADLSGSGADPICCSCRRERLQPPCWTSARPQGGPFLLAVESNLEGGGSHNRPSPTRRLRSQGLHQAAVCLGADEYLSLALPMVGRTQNDHVPCDMIVLHSVDIIRGGGPLCAASRARPFSRAGMKLHR